MNPTTLRATEMRCLNENDRYTLVVLDGDRELARFAFDSQALSLARAAIDRAMLLRGKLSSLGNLSPPPDAEPIIDLPPLELHEACVVVGAALRRVAPNDDVVGFELFPRGNGIFDWSLEDAGPLGALYDAAVRRVLGQQAGHPLGTPMTAPEFVDPTLADELA